MRTLRWAAVPALLVVALVAGTALAQVAGSTVVRDPQVVDTCVGRTNSEGFILCDVPTGNEVGSGLEGHPIIAIVPTLRGPFSGLRNLPSANISQGPIDQANGQVRLRVLGTEIIRWADGHLGPIPYRSNVVSLRVVVFYAED